MNLNHKITFIVLLFGLVAQGQQITYAPKDKALFKVKLDALLEIQAAGLGDSIADIGKLFLGTTYKEKTLEIGNSETLVVNFSGMDCTTFVENVLAFASMLKRGRHTFDDFAHSLKTIRYRNGLLNGYPSRLHYFTEWIRNNQKKGFVKDITSELGGHMLIKPINFMGTHRILYPFLADDENYEAMLGVEKEMAKEELCYLPKGLVESKEHLIRSGDIIALSTSIEGLDVTHTGIAIRMPDGRLHLLHASSKNGKVEVSQQPLAEYLKSIKNNIGIVVARPVLN